MLKGGRGTTPARAWGGPSDERSEDGAILVIWAVALVAIMGLVALAIDLGNIAQTKQHTANAAQDAVLSAVTDLSVLAPGGTGAITATDCGYQSGFSVLQEAVACAEDYLSKNYTSSGEALPSSIDANANSTYDSCGSALPSTMYFVPGENCFGFFNPSDSSKNSTNPNAMAVAVPARTVKYTFGQVAGLTSQNVSSTAYASIQTADNGYILPYGFATGGSYGYNCLKDTSGNTSCLGALLDGQFGLIDNPRYVIFPYEDTSNGVKSYALLANADLGVDHPLVPYPASGSVSRVCDWQTVLNGCDSDNYVAPYTGGDYLNTSNGQTVNDLTGPLFTGTTTNTGCNLSARFTHPDGFLASQTCSDDQTSGASGSIFLKKKYGDTFGVSDSADLNGKSIAYYLSSGFTSSALYTAAGCDAKKPAGGTSTALDVTTDGKSIDFTTFTNMAWKPFNDCLSGLFSSANMVNQINTIVTGGTPVFSSDIEKSPRFGVIPVVTYNTSGKASEITSLYGVYLDVAIPKTAKGNSEVGALQAWVFPLTWIQSTSTSGSGLGREIGGNYVTNLCAYGVNC